MIDCHDDLVQMYVAGELQAVEAEIVESHLATCEACRRRVASYKSLFWDLEHAGQQSTACAMETAALAERLRAEWLDGHAPKPARAGTMATLWLTANPVVAGPAHAMGDVAGRAASRMVTRLGERLLGRRGGGNR